MGKSAIFGVVYEVCEATWKALQPEYVKMPSYEEEWLAVSKDFEEIWNFPNCVGAIDGKHIVTQAPRNAGCCSLILREHTQSFCLLCVTHDIVFLW